MDAWNTGLFFFQLFPFIFAVAVGFFIYYLKKNQKTLNKNGKPLKLKKSVEDKELMKSSLRESFKLVPVIASFFGSISIILIAFFVGVLIFKSVGLAFIFAVLISALILYIFSKKFKKFGSKKI